MLSLFRKELPMLPGIVDVALKEWSVTVDALARGDQVFILRKGGIREDNRQFKIEHDQFFLYPTFFHENSELIKPEKSELISLNSMEEDEEIVTLSVFAEIEEVIELNKETELKALEQFHIWSTRFIYKRLNWKPRNALNLIILRCHLLQQPQALTVMPDYAGCKSWVELIEDYPVGVTTPVISNARFTSMVSDIKNNLLSV